jgi:hypothetical protein
MLACFETTPDVVGGESAARKNHITILIIIDCTITLEEQVRRRYVHGNRHTSGGRSTADIARRSDIEQTAPKEENLAGGVTSTPDK